MKTEFKYFPVSKREMLKCVRWCKEVLRVKDWEVTLLTQCDVPNGMGNCETAVGEYKVTVQINNKQCKIDDAHPIQVLIHEMIHVFTHNTTMAVGNGEKVSQLFEYPLTCLYIGKRL